MADNLKDRLKVYNHRVDRGLKYLDDIRPQVVDAFARYRNNPAAGSFKGTADNGNHVAVPIAVGVIDAMFSALSATEIDADVEIVRGHRDQARLAATALKQVWYETKGARKGARALKEGILSGFGWVKVSYDFVAAEVERDMTKEEIEAKVAELFDYAKDQELPTPAPDEIAQLVPVKVTEKQVLHDRIVLDAVPWDEVVFEPTARRVEDLRWIAQVSKLPLDEVRNHPNWKDYCEKAGTAAKLEALTGDATIDDSKVDGKSGAVQTTASGRTKDDDLLSRDDERVTVISYYNLVEGTACVFAKGKDWLLDETINPYAVKPDLEDRNPFVLYSPREDVESVRGISEMQVMLASLDELNTYRSNLSTYLSRNVSKYKAREGSLSAGAKTALASKEWGAVAELSDMDDLDVINPPQIAQELLGMDERIQSDIWQATGINELRRGLFAPSRRSATETAAVEQNSDIRQSEKRNRLEHFYEDILRRVLLLMQTFYDKARIARLVDVEEGTDVEWAYTNEEIALETKVRIHLTPKQDKTLQEKQDLAISLANLLLPLSVQGGPVDAPGLLTWFMQEMGLSDEVISEVLNTLEEQKAQVQQAIDQQAQATQATAAAGAQGQVQGAAAGAQDAANVGTPEKVAEQLAGSFGPRPVAPQLAGS